jgi:hypothetical protein
VSDWVWFFFGPIELALMTWMCSFVPFLEAQDAVATLLDPNQPVPLLTSAVRFLSLLACRESSRAASCS